MPKLFVSVLSLSWESSLLSVASFVNFRLELPLSFGLVEVPASTAVGSGAVAEAERGVLVDDIVLALSAGGCRLVDARLRWLSP